MSSNDSNVVDTVQIKDAQNNLKSIPIYKQNTKLYYKQGGSNVSLVPVQIIKVHLDDIEPYYTIRLLDDDSSNNCREKQTDNDHLTLDKPISNDEFGDSSSDEEMERLQSRRVHWKNEDKSQTSSSDVEQEDDKTSSSSKSSSKTLHTWQLEQIAKHVNNQKEDTTEVEEKKKVLESWQLDQISKHMKQKQSSTTSSTYNDNKSKEMGDASDEGEECSIVTEECSIDTNDSSKNDTKTEGIEQQQVVAMEESWFCC